MRYNNYFFVSHSSYLHGAETCLLHLIRVLRLKENCNIHVLLPFDDSDSEMVYSLKRIGCQVHYLPYAKTRWVDTSFHLFSFTLQTLALIPRIFKLYCRVKPNVVVLNSLVLSPVFAMVAGFLRIPRIWHILELGIEDHGYRFLLGRSLTFLLIFRLASGLVFLSNFIKTKFLYGDKEFTFVIPPAFETSFTNQRSVCAPSIDESTKWSILVLGRTAEGKGQIDAIRAMHVLIYQNMRYDLHLTLVGVINNTYTKEIRSLASQLNLDEFISWIPFSSSSLTNEYLQRADLGLVTSRNEAFGRITVEYMLNGLIVVGADYGGTSEILDQFRTSTFRYKPGNYFELAQVINSITQRNRTDYKYLLEEQALKANDIYSDESHYELWSQVFSKFIKRS
jgi:glycosyltransferase involved in cell wall biosynthesis